MNKLLEDLKAIASGGEPVILFKLHKTLDKLLMAFGYVGDSIENQAAEVVRRLEEYEKER